MADLDVSDTLPALQQEQALAACIPGALLAAPAPSCCLITILYGNEATAP